MRCTTSINGEPVGEGGAFNLAGGFVRSVQFLLALTAKRNRPLRAGDIVATGQTTGVHKLTEGQVSVTTFGEDGEIGVKAIAATAID